MNFDAELFNTYITVLTCGIGMGFGIGFISWGIGFGIYSIIRWCKMA